MKVLIIGADGFIGKKLSSEVLKNHDLVKVNRNSELRDIFDNENSYDFVINCASSLPNSTQFESNKSNFLYAKQFLDNINSKHWIQIESYFQLQILMGRSDHYSIEKQKFSKYLDTQSKITTLPKIHHLYLPHIFGEGDKPGRLISSAINAFKKAEILKASSGSQFIPILHVSDAVIGITKFIENPATVAACTPFWYGTVKELLEFIASQFENVKIAFGSESDSMDASFPRVEFPGCVKGWSPKMQINEFAVWIKSQNV
jgi:nucleoside-diphosphate-sugar epimerase